MSQRWKRRGIYFSRRRRRRLWVVLMLMTLMAITSAIIITHENRGSEELSRPRKAVILDGLSTDYPNRTFIESAEEILRQAGFEVDVYSFETISLGLLRELPARDYGLVVFRVHGGRIRQPIGLFMGGGLFVEPCGPDSYREEVESGYLLLGKPYFSDQVYCVAPPHYITDKLNGRFRGTLVLAMSCFTGDDEIMAKAFFERGAAAYIGFSGKVSPPYVDAFAASLLRELYVNGLPLEEAFNKVRNELGPDPHYGGTPTLYMP